MNRLSFKAWDKVRKEWIHEEPCHLIGENILMGGWLDSISIERFDDVVVLQSTGLTDNNGKEIFEGDLFKRPVTINQHNFGEWSLLEVKIHNGITMAYHVISEKGQVIPRGYTGCFLHECEEDVDMKLLLFSDSYTFHDIEIIGNIYDNPELLNEQS